ncbi:hypothetical protein HGM15179_008912 [Zosterops borbonicus]|uniref:Uncharacterized protein n=1 Tax=Zosterops borbonicus TaxID=364589 RepID=A0A8K1GG73_9PASS|nr:hypothetical protein HGM15179_008912 [Zosterops borbonicus]
MLKDKEIGGQEKPGWDKTDGTASHTLDSSSASLLLVNTGLCHWTAGTWLQFTGDSMIGKNKELEHYGERCREFGNRYAKGKRESKNINMEELDDRKLQGRVNVEEARKVRNCRGGNKQDIEVEEKERFIEN